MGRFLPGSLRVIKCKAVLEFTGVEYMPTATVTSKGQTTIPREVRNFLNLKPGDKLEFKLNPNDRTVVLKAANIHIASLRGILKTEGMKPYDSNERVIAVRKRVRKK